ncbi:MAG: extracellular solute-binding protein [Ruminococcaceae bacterium]|nr:extracellular solute-binding protein [Oscillospiraceae bacterium]
MRRTRYIAILLAVLMTASSCGGGTSTDTTTSTSSADTTSADTAEKYPYESADFGGYEFTFLNLDVCDWANQMLVPEESTGELLNDAIFERNMKVEEALNITIRELTGSVDSLASLVKTAVTAGDPTYDVAMTQIHDLGGLLSDGYFVDLAEISTINLDEPWWDQTIVEAATIKDHCYFATSDITFHPFEATWVMYFHKEKFEKLGLEDPYQVVRDGKWTMDKLTEYVSQSANLNGQETFKFDQTNGTAEYGVVSHNLFMEGLILCFGENLLDESGDMPVFVEANERLVTAFEKITALTKPDGYYLDRDSDGIQGGADRISVEFKKGRTLFMSETLGHIANLRDGSFDFGILPMPKLDEKQENYISLTGSWGTLMTTIPKSCSDPERAGKVLDMMAYESSISLIEPYYDTWLTQKGVRDEESAEMLQIIQDTRTINIGKMFGWTTSLTNSSLIVLLAMGNPDVTSKMAAQKDSINAAIAKTYEAFE